MMLIKIAGQDSFQMTLVQFDDMIQTVLASDILRTNALISFDTDGLPGLPCLLGLAE